VQDGWGQCKREAGTGDDARTIIIRLEVSGQQQIGKSTTVLGTRCFSGLTGQPRLCALLRALSPPKAP